MLTQPQIAQVADDLKNEAQRRSYVRHILSEEFARDPQSWELIIEMLEVVLHKRNLYIVPQDRIEGFVHPRSVVRNHARTAAAER